jgi:hypothetical protein
MEKAVFITNPRQLKYADNSYSRLYYGNEFCERLIPSVGELQQVLSYVNKKKLNFSLATPYVTDYGLQKLRPLFELMREDGRNSEIIINDWGVLRLSDATCLDAVLVLGRLLTKQKRGPGLRSMLERNFRPRLVQASQNPQMRYLVFQKKLPLGLDPYYRGSNVSSVPAIHDFLASRGIRRIELDNTEQGLFLKLPKGKISASLYLPYVYISTTFFCPTAGCSRNKYRLLKIKPCKRECQKYVFKLRHKSLHKVIYLKGNTQFYKNTDIRIKEWARAGIDRIVYEPEVPV